MTLAIVAVLALLAGLVVGYILGAKSAAAEKSLLAGQNQAALAELAAVRAELSAKAGFEPLAAERLGMIDSLTAEKNTLAEQLQAKSDESGNLATDNAKLKAKLEAEETKLAEKVALLEGAETKLGNHFQKLAQDILDQKEKTFAEGSQERISTLLKPLEKDLKEFRDKVESAQKDSNAGVTKLETLVTALNGLNQQISEDARNLTTALRGSAKTQGDWGEFILRDLLDKAGLREGEQYSFQQSFGVESENGERARTVRTDVIISLPGGRSLVIDSKVSLTAYTDWTAAEGDEPRKAALRAHLASVRGHVTNLSKAGYHRLPGVEAPDFVVLFVPIEPAFLLALQNDSELWADAYKQGILLVGPTTLLYVIRIVNVLWQQERQARNVSDVMERGAELYDKFVGFVTDMEAIGDSLRRTDTSYANAMKKLSEGRGNLVRQVELLKQLGIRTTKSLPKSLVDKADTDEPTLLSIAAEGDEHVPS